jgi:uncharacterized membrane protein YeaQ/YmgE (transglycosylase-associated protein family)
MTDMVLFILAMFFIELAVTGAIVGWLWSLLAKGYSLGLMRDILVGIIGAVVIGGLLIHFVNFFSDSIVTVILAGIIGAVILLVVVAFFKKTPAAA